MQSVAERLAALPRTDQLAALAHLTDAEAEELLHDWRGFHARPEQIAPEGDWDIWCILAGRGWGKTRTGAEWVREQVNAGARRIALVAETQKDLEQVMVEGDSGILAVFPEAERPEYKKKPVELRFPNGAIALGYNGTEPGQLRGPQFDAAWCDELAKWRYARETWDMLQFGMRLGDHPRQLVTTTPQPIEIIKSIVAGSEGRVVVTKGRTFDNRANLAAPFLAKITAKYAGTRLGRQELNAEILGDLPGALWTQSVIDLYRETTPIAGPIQAAELLGITRIVVAVDPAVTATEDSDEHGILVVGIGQGQTGYVLEDASQQGTPHEWAQAVFLRVAHWQADCAVVEVNQGGDLVAHTLRTVAPSLNIREVRASRGKHVRAEPIAALYQQGRIRHVGQFPTLENQMTQMTNQGYQGAGSPDRVDALVWAASNLFPDMISAPVDASRFHASRPRRGWAAR